VSASLRFLALAVIGWAGVRAATLGMIPGTHAFTLSRAKPEPRFAASRIPPVVPTQFPSLEAEPALSPQPPSATAGFPMLAAYPQFVRIPVPLFHYPAAYAPAAYYPAALPPPPPRRPLTRILPEPEPLFYSPIPQLDEWPLSRMASAAIPPRRSSVTEPQQSLSPAAAAKRRDRIELSTWALLRNRQGIVSGPSSLSTVGTLGGSQAGARLSYNFSPQLAASLRTSSTVGARGGEVAAGVRYRPLRSIPVALTLERRQALGRYGGGRSAFALFAEGGLYQRPVGWGLNLDAYAQGGVVGAGSRDLFFDGGATLTRPVYGRYSAGFGVWGGVQPGLYRVDAGPRVTVQLRPNIRAHVDWRQRLAGNAEPGSGPALTLAADF
jgi:hypothetical protein